MQGKEYSLVGIIFQLVMFRRYEVWSHCTTSDNGNFHLSTILISLFLLKKETIERCSRLKRECIPLIERGAVAEAGALVKRTFEKRRVFRRRHLTLLYPDAEFMTLDGEVFSSETYALCDFDREQSTSDNENSTLSADFISVSLEARKEGEISTNIQSS